MAVTSDWTSATAVILFWKNVEPITSPKKAVITQRTSEYDGVRQYSRKLRLRHTLRSTRVSGSARRRAD